MVPQKHRNPVYCVVHHMTNCLSIAVHFQTIRHYHGHLSACYSVDIHPTIDVIVTCGRDATARVSEAFLVSLFHMFSVLNTVK